MILLAGADLVLPDRVVGSGTVVIDGDRIVDVVHGPRGGGEGDLHFAFPQHYIVPGFIDLHVHGVEGRDTLGGGGAIEEIAGRMPKFGVTAFCPTSIACAPPALREMLAAVRRSRTTRPPGGARVLPAHLESNFISPEFKGAQPQECLRLPPAPSAIFSQRSRGPTPAPSRSAATGLARTADAPRSADLHPPTSDWDGTDILCEIAAARPDVGIVTVAPELDGALELIRDLVNNGHHVSLGHSGATYEQGVEGIRAGARQATHLFNRMTPVSHHAPGLAGAVLESDDVFTELISDGVHVHAAMMRVAMAAKRPERVIAITDGTAGSGLPRGSRSAIGGRAVTVRDAAYLDDDTLAGSVITMDRAFALLVSGIGLSLSDAATVCSTTPARALNLQGFGVIAPGATADLVILDRDLQVVQTWIGGALAWSRRLS
jgi:N-acetylglucosamine-6-phosphate deacetylase